MTETAEHLKAALSQLSREDRAALARFLITSLDEDEADADDDDAWAAEIQRRVEEIDSGKESGIPVEEVLAELRAKYP
jgi:putative addiction module component (TIGR02574 family)